MKKAHIGIDSDSSRNNFVKLSPRNFQLIADLDDDSFLDISNSATEIVLSDSRFARINGRFYSLTFLKGFSCVESAQELGDLVVDNMNTLNPELGTRYNVNIDSNSVKLVFKTNLNVKGRLI
jgi:hypothetical protein